MEEAVAGAERLLRQGEPLLAYNLADAALAASPSNLRLRQLQALALARSGDLERANRLLAELVDAGVDDAETLGVLARTHKDLGQRATDPERREANLAAAWRLYLGAYTAAGTRGESAAAYYTGINAATVAVLRGDLASARRIAAEVRAICTAAGPETDGTPADYWRLATLGEAEFILGDVESAARHYARAVALAGGRYGDLSSTRRQARLLAKHLPQGELRLSELLLIPPVLVLTGNMIDLPGRDVPRFPPELEPVVRRLLRERFSALRPLAVYGSAACGADILGLEVAHELGAEIHVVLPFPPSEFREASVEIVAGDWGERFDRLLGLAATVTVTSDHRASGSTATFEYGNLVMTGLARLRAEVLDTTLIGFAVWDPVANGLPGGAASMVGAWRERGIVVDELLLSDLRTRLDARAAIARSVDLPKAGPAPDGHTHAIKALLFADAVGFSKLTEDQIPRYVEGFLGAVARLNRRTRHRHEHVETAGDGLYMVFDRAADAARYALELSALADGTDWTEHGLPSGFNLRIALHCGPVYCGRDPVTDAPLYTGPHTSRAARIEPITPPGQVYASSAFAAVAAASGAEGISLRYVGTIPLAKRAGSLALYHVRPEA
ncbi:MAG: tetratricopeptide repeat-containing protein [Steroidobacteraceae bacterium]